MYGVVLSPRLVVGVAKVIPACGDWSNPDVRELSRRRVESPYP
jgi:hypothetical protein